MRALSMTTSFLLRLLPLRMKKKITRFAVGNTAVWSLYCRMRYGLKSQAEGNGIYRYSADGWHIKAYQTNVDIYDEVVREGIYNKVLSLKAGDTVIDVGAHIGLFSILASRVVGPQGLVMAIEPEPNNAVLLRENLKLNNVDNVRVVKKAAWKEKGQADINISLDGSGHSLKRKLSGKTSMVELDTLDNILNEAGVNKVDFIKMDIEGAEKEALEGAVGILQQKDIKLAIAAYHGKCQHKEIADYLLSKDFTISTWQNSGGSKFIGAQRSS